MGKGFTGGVIFEGKGTAIYVDNGVIEAAGTDEDIVSRLKEGDERIDLNGALICPGFIAAGVSVVREGLSALAVPLDHAEDAGEILNRIVSACPLESCLAGKGLKKEMAGSGLKEMADRESRKIILFCEDGASCFLNHAAAADLPEDAAFNGKNGILTWEDGDPVLPVRWTAGDLEKMILAGASRYASLGFTGLLSDDFGMFRKYDDILDAFLRLDHQEKLPLRISELCRFREAEELARFLDEGYTEGVGGQYFRIGRLRTGVIGEDELVMVRLANMYNMGTMADGVMPGIEPEDAVYPGNPLGSGFISDSLSPAESAFLKEAGLTRCMSAEKADESCDLICVKNGRLFPAEAVLPAAELIRRYSSSQRACEWDVTGVIAEGYAADVTILKDGKVLMTLCGGREAAE